MKNKSKREINSQTKLREKIEEGLNIAEGVEMGNVHAREQAIDFFLFLFSAKEKELVEEVNNLKRGVIVRNGKAEATVVNLDDVLSLLKGERKG